MVFWILFLIKNSLIYKYINNKKHKVENLPCVFVCYNFFMKIDSISFGNRIENGEVGRIKYSREYSDDNILLVNKELDAQTDKFLKVQHFDVEGNLLDTQEYMYFPNKMVEYYKNKSQEYTRTIIDEVKEGARCIKEIFCSVTSPDCNYTRETIKDFTGKIVNIYQDGKKLL